MFEVENKQKRLLQSNKSFSVSIINNTYRSKLKQPERFVPRITRI